MGRDRLRFLLALWFGLLASVAVACGPDAASPGDGGPGDPAASSGLDASMEAPPAGQEGGTGGDAGAPEAGLDDDGLLGTLSGACGVVKTLLLTAEPSHVDNVLTFTAGETYEKSSLSPEAQILFDEPNAGGSSVESEVMSFEVLRHCEDAALVKTETQISYGPLGPAGTNAITDILVSIAGKKVGVSVTRAYKPKAIGLTDDDVRTLLESKLEGIKQSSARVLPEDRWVKQILHVFAVDKDAADAVARILPTLAAETRADTIVLVTRTEGGGFVYCNPDPPLGSECN
jgi:hypothetical protein